METNQKPWKTMKPPWKTMETNQKPWNHLETTLKNYGNQPKTMKNHTTTLKNHGNQPKTIKNHETTLKNNMSLTQGPNRPPLIQKRYVTYSGPQLTSIDPKTLRHSRGAPTDLHWSKNVMSLTRGQTDLLDV